MPEELTSTVLVKSWQALSCLQLGQHQAARTALREIEKAELHSAGEGELASSLLLQVAATDRHRQLTGAVALSLAQRLSQAFPASADAINQLALWQYLLTDEAEQAIPTLGHALVMEPWRVDLRSVLAQRYVDTERYDEFYRMMEVIDYSDEIPGIFMAENLRALSYVFFERGYEDAVCLGLSLSEKFAEQFSDDGEAHFSRGYFLELAQANDEALREMELASEMLPDREDMHKLLAQTYDRRGREEEALSHWLRVPLSTWR